MNSDRCFVKRRAQEKIRESDRGEQSRSADRFRSKAVSGRELGRFFVAKDANGLLKLLDLERLFQDGDRAFGQNPIQHLTVGITGDNHDRQFGIDLFGRFVNIVRRTIGQLEIEKEQIEPLLLERGE